MEILKTAALLAEFRRESRKAPETRRRTQNVLLRQAVVRAARNVPFYRRVWKEAGVDPARIREVDDLALLPVISPDTARAAARRGDLSATGARADLPRFPSGGSSTGTPLQVPRGEVEQRLWRAGGLRIQLEHGFRWWDATAQLSRTSGPPPHPLQRIGIARTVWISHEAPVDEQIERLIAARAGFVFGHVTTLRRIGRAVSESGKNMPPPRAVFCMGEVLDDDSWATIRDAFGVVPTDIYGMGEAGFIAWQCERRAELHVNSDTFIVEILRDGRPAHPGEIGRVVVTNFRHRTMPLLRVSTGDLAEALDEPCACGRTLPTIGRIEGRERHAIETEGGGLLTQRTVLNRFAGLLRMGEYRLRRISESELVLEKTAHAFAQDATENDVRGAVRDLFGNVELAFATCNAFPRGLKTHAFVDEAGESGDGAKG